MTNFTKIALSIAAIASLNACGGGSSSTPTDPVNPVDPVVTCTTPSTTTLAGDLTGCTLLTADKTWELDGLVVVTPGAELRIEAGTTITAQDGTGDATSYLIVDKGAKIMAEGTVDKPIVFTSLDPSAKSVGLWGGVTIIGNAANSQVNPYEVNTAFVAGTSSMADNSGILRHVKILNSGITMEQDKEINGLSLVGVGSGTVIDNITVDYSDDDGIEVWGGTVNMSNITISHCTDDHFDIDDGYSGTVTNLKITQTTGNAAMEMSGTTAATFDGLTIVQNTSAKEGTVFFKGAGIGGHFKNATITDNVTSATLAGAIHSNDVGVAIDTVSFENVTLNGTSTEPRFTGLSAAALEAKFNSGTKNTTN
ncbi:right-handed parallel beta-helix repeat-containing protein [Sulfurovum sp.]|uniref:right-handed parallel beta-helix repeat-containing protein n=1 Tax=Sulfurovum sp. TaxID=1969726 RepID=UPI002868150B|nr:hypothetical protein [Sulfurovum sp.]